MNYMRDKRFEGVGWGEMMSFGAGGWGREFSLKYQMDMQGCPENNI